MANYGFLSISMAYLFKKTVKTNSFTVTKSLPRNMVKTENECVALHVVLSGAPKFCPGAPNIFRGEHQGKNEKKK